MSGRRTGLDSMLGRARLGAASIARVLILAFALQLLAPLLDLGAVAASFGEAGLQADLQSSLCHDASTDQPRGSESGTIKHCVFCLPMAGDHATTGTAPALTAPRLLARVVVTMVDDQVGALTRPSFARSRAPPASPRTV